MKSLIERADQYLKDRLSRRLISVHEDGGCDLEHVRNWLNLFVDIHNARRRHLTFRELMEFLGG
jgi:hypothetical protein